MNADLLFETNVKDILPCFPKQITSYDMANCKVAKGGKLEKTTTDNAKLLIEGKMILDVIARTCGMKFGDAKKLKVGFTDIRPRKIKMVEFTIGKIIFIPNNHQTYPKFLQS